MANAYVLTNVMGKLRISKETKVVDEWRLERKMWANKNYIMLYFYKLILSL